MSSPMTPNSAASSHSATACGWIERSVFTDWVESRKACTGLPPTLLLSSWLHRGPVPAAVVEPQRYLGETAQRPVLAVEGGGAPGDIGAVPRLRRELRLRRVDPGDMEHERHRPTGCRAQHQRQRVPRPQVEPLGQGERDIDLAGPGGIGEAARKDLPFPEAAGDRVTGRCDELDDARGHIERLDHRGVRGLGNPHHRSGREPGEARIVRLGGYHGIGRPAPVEETGIGGAGPPRSLRSRHHPSRKDADDQREGEPGPPVAPRLRPQEQPDRGHRTTSPDPGTRRPARHEPHCSHVPIPAARGRTVNDAGTLTAVVLPAGGWRCRAPPRCAYRMPRSYSGSQPTSRPDLYEFNLVSAPLRAHLRTISCSGLRCQF